MKISVIAIFYNSASYVSKCVDSILEQTGDFELELIAVDDCSQDDTYAVLSSYGDSRLKIIRHEKNSGISAARNTGMQNVSGDSFFFIDGDDFLPQGVLSVLAKHFANDVDWVQGGYAVCDEQDKVLSVKSNPNGIYGSHQDIVDSFECLEFIYTHNRLINAKWKNLLFPIGKAHEDRFWNVRAFPDVKKIVNVSDVTYNYIAHSSSFSNKSRASLFYIDSALELLSEMDSLEHCWKGIADIFLITAIEKNLYLWSLQSAYRKSILGKIKERSQKVSINVGGFPRFTKLIHKMIVQGYPDCCVEMVAWFYRTYIALTHKNV